ncbi:diguanylate cyclase [Hydrogenovibrio sp. 3SP14C1]|uniref:diguanylate cyclase n=1 Tax=Hydrogenovibrio sp. 3SP14C1 TaxID=3038774 RepID=UPI002416F17A|nr:diguanylate cyclase [Hydrogenovibrio sp. 3SP14C1]MDG4812585.1 diguanylate cyclase [Hydrogenovibrio sp. 3SP14C1]
MSFFFSVNGYAAPQSKIPSPDSPTLLSVQVNWNHQFQFAGFYAALKQGYYQDAGLRVTIKDWRPGVRVLDEVLSGRADIGVGYSSMIADYAKGAPIKLIMSSFQFSPMVLLSHKQINDLTELDGKTVMHYRNLQILGLIDKASSVVKHPIISVDSSGNLQDFIDHKVDLYGAYATNEPFRLKQQNKNFFVVDPKSFGIQSYGDLVITSESFAAKHPDSIQKFKTATVKGWEYAIYHQADMVDYIMQHYPVVKSREALLNEAMITTRYVKSGLVPIGQIEPAKLLATAAEAKEVGLISQKEFNQLNMEQFIFNASKYAYTAEELAYLAEHPVIKLANDIDWEPFEFIDKKGQYRGIAADYFALLGQKLGVTFEAQKNLSWVDVLSQVKAGKLEIFSCAVATPDRRKYMRFTKPYLSFPMVLAGRNDVSFIENYEALEGEKVAVVNGYWSHETLKQYYPGIELVVVDSVKEGLEAVMDGRAKVYSGNLGAINFAINQYGLTGIHVVGQSSHRFELAIGVSKNNPILFSILRKGLASITDEDRQAIFNKWIQLEVVNKLDRKQLIEMGSVIFVIIITLLFFLLMFRYQKNRQQAYIEKIHELTYATLINMETLKFDWVSDSFIRLVGYSREEVEDIRYLDLATSRLSQEEQNAILKQLNSGQSWKGEMEGRAKDGSSYWVELTLTPVQDVMGHIKQVWATRVDITDRKRNEQLSITDELTGLYNRRYFNLLIKQEINRAKREKRSLSVAMMDIDFFKKINDTRGHQEGDEVLKQVADVFRSSFHRATDFVFRMGGEEFFVISLFKSEAEFQTYLEQFCLRVQALGIENKASSEGVLTVSIGAAYCEAEALESSEALYKTVDQRLYQAKQSGRNKVVMAD